MNRAQNAQLIGVTSIDCVPDAFHGENQLICRQIRHGVHDGKGGRVTVWNSARIVPESCYLRRLANRVLISSPRFS